MARPKQVRIATPPTPEQLARLQEARKTALDACANVRAFTAQLPAQLVAWDDAPVDFGGLTRDCLRVAHDLVLLAAWAEKQTLA